MRVMLAVIVVASMFLGGCREGQPSVIAPGGELRTPPPVIYDER